MDRFTLTEEEARAIRAARDSAASPQLRRRLDALLLRRDGLPLKEVAARLGMEPASVSRLCQRYRRQGLAEFSRAKYGVHCRLLTPEEEARVLQSFRAEAGGARAGTVKAALDAACGRDTGSAYVYAVLHRHGWQKHSVIGSDGKRHSRWIPGEAQEPQPFPPE